MSNVQDSEIPSVGPRITPADIEAAIVYENFHVASQAPQSRHDYPLSMDLLTICVLVLRNGFTVVGTSACASRENFDAEIGRRIARQDAVRQIWPLLGYALRDRLSKAAQWDEKGQCYRDHPLQSKPAQKVALWP